MTCSRDAGRVEESLRNDNDLPLLIPLRHSTLSDFNSAPGRHQRDACMFSKVSEGERFICNSNEIKHFQKEEVSSPTHCSKADHKKSGPKIPKSTINGNGSETEEKSPQEEVSDRPDTVGSKPASSLKFSSPALHSLASLTINCYNSNTSNNNNINDDQLHSIDLRKFPMTLSNPENIKSLSPQNLPVPVSDFWSGHVQSPEGSLEVVSSSFRDPLTLSCNICPFSGDSLEEMDSHLQVSHLTFRCFVCNFTSRSQARLSRHLAENHDNVDGFDFRSKKKEDGKRLKRHRKYSCKQCPFSTSVQEEIWMHTKVHVPASKLLSCPRCPFVCAFKHHMQYHLNNHFGFKPYKCDLCNYRCNNKSMLNSHLKSHSNEYPFKCTKCSYATKYRQALHIHSAKANHALDDREKIESSASNWTKPAKSQRVSFPVEDKSSQKLVGRLDNLWGKTGAAEMKEEPVGASNAVGCINPFNLNFSFPTLKSPSSLSLNSLLMSYVSHQPCEDTVQPHPWTRMTNDGSVGEMLKAEEIKSEEETDQALVSSQTDREPMNSHPLDLRVKRTNLELRYDEEVNRCNFCDLIFHDSVLFWCHMTCHSPGMPFRCNLCGRATKDKVDFFAHLCEFSHNTEALKKFSSDCHSLSLR